MNYYILIQNYILPFILLFSILIPVLINNSIIRNVSLFINSVIFLILLYYVNLYLIKKVFYSTVIKHIIKINYISFHIEPIGLILINLISILWTLTILYSIAFLNKNELKKIQYFLFFLNLANVIGILICLSADLITMFIFYELLTFITIPLIAYNNSYKKVHNNLSVYIKTLMMSSIGLFLPAIIIIKSKLGHCDFISNGIFSNNFSNFESQIILILITLGVSKSIIYPFYKWLPSGMIAVYPVSALLHAVLVVKIGIFCIIKTYTYIFGITYLHKIFINYNWFIIIPLISIVFSATKSLVTNNIKKKLAYSTMNQINICALSVAIFTKESLKASILHMLSHSLSKICLFYAAGIFYSIKKTINIKDLSGIYQYLPLSSIIFTCAGLSIAGIAPLWGFFTKKNILLISIKQGYILTSIVIILNNIISIFYIKQFITTIYFNHPITRVNTSKIKSQSLYVMQITLVITFVLLLLFFVYHDIIINLLNMI